MEATLTTAGGKRESSIVNREASIVNRTLGDSVIPATEYFELRPMIRDPPDFEKPDTRCLRNVVIRGDPGSKVIVSARSMAGMTELQSFAFTIHDSRLTIPDSPPLSPYHEHGIRKH
jgi:hypothetical protein